MSASLLEQTIRSPTPPPAELEPRLFAFAIDRALGWGPPLVLTWVLVATDQPWTIVLGAVLGLALVLLLGFAGLLAASGATPGLAATGLRLHDAQAGRPPTFAAAVRRQAILAVAGLPTFGLGLATLSWTALTDPAGTRRGWHDQVTGTVLLDVRPAPAPEAPRERPQPIVNLTAMRLSPADPVAPSTQAVPVGPSTPAIPVGPSTPAVPVGPPTQAVPVGPAALPTPVVPARVVSAGQIAPPQIAPLQIAPPQVAPPQIAPRPGRRRAGVPVPPTQVATQRTAQPTAPPATALPTPQPRDGSGRWRVRFDTGEDFVVAGLVLIGRGPQPRPGETVAHLVGLRSADMSVSKTHAQVQPVADGSLVAMDRGSTNGSVVIRRGVPRRLSPGRPMTLLEGDVVRFGDRAMEVSRAR